MKIKSLYIGIIAIGLYLLSASVGAYSLDTVAGRLSQANSEITPRDQVIHFKNELAHLTARLRDDFNNPVRGHVVKLISSSETDLIKYRDGVGISDRNGEISFQITPGAAGLVKYSLYDVTADEVLQNRAKIVYFDSAADVLENKAVVKLAASGDASSGNAAGPIDQFEFEEIPSNVTANQSTTIKVTAYDSAKQVVSNYAGKVRFSIDGANSGFATLPEDYTFVAQDQGSHVFSLAFNFKQPGSYNLKVTDLANMAVFGTKTILVTAGSGSSVNSTVTQSAIVITNPFSGTNSSTNVQVISGTAPAASKLKIFDNNLELASVVTDSSGKFSYTTGLLADGPHKIYVATVNDIGTVIATSPTVDITIDTKAAKISQIVLDPSGAVDPKTSVNVKAYSDDNLSKAEVVVAGNVYVLTKNAAGYYETSFAAPIDFGEYKLNFKFVDDLGNETKSDDKILKVGNVGLVNKTKPEKVMGLTATTSDGRVVLNWLAPSAASVPIKNYRVYYGLSPNQLVNAVDTFTNATTWYVANLKNGTEYYFAVAGVDAKGNESGGFDKILPAIPGGGGGAVKAVQPPDVKNGTAGKEALKEMKTDASKTGPEIFWLIVLSVFGGMFYSLFYKQKSN